MKSFRILFLLSWMLSVNAYSLPLLSSHPDAEALSEQCKKLSIDLYTLSNKQPRKICRRSLDGLNVYYASNFIMHNLYDRASKVLFEAIIQVKYALDIGCEHPDKINEIITGLQAVKNGVNTN